MAVSTKSKRKLVYKDKTYYWHVSQDYDRGELRNNFNILHIIADDKSMEYHIPLEFLSPIVQKLENKKQIIKRLRELENSRYQRKDVKHK